MAEETLLTAARRASRFLKIDLNKGGLIVQETLIALDTLDKEIEKATVRIKREGKIEITEDYGS